jgi:hypothetical protein
MLQTTKTSDGSGSSVVVDLTRSGSSRGKKPPGLGSWLLEMKMIDTSLSPSLALFQAQTQAAHAFQLVVSLACQPADCFRVRRPVVVPARTFLRQLL